MCLARLASGAGDDASGDAEPVDDSPIAPLPLVPSAALYRAEAEALAASDSELKRLLDAREQKVDAAAALLEEIARFRAIVRPDLLVPAAMPAAMPSGTWTFAGHTTAGWPILVVRCVHWKPAHYSGIDEYIRYVAYFMEVQVRARMGAGVSRHMIIFDMAQYSAAQMTPLAFRCAQQLISIVSQQYPERLGVCVSVNCSLLFQTFWAMCSPFVDAKTKKKLCFVSGSDGAHDPASRARTHAVLSRFIADDALEECYGGTHAAYPHPRTYGDVSERIAAYAGTNPPLNAKEERVAICRAALGDADDDDFARDDGDGDDDSGGAAPWRTRELLVGKEETVDVPLPPASAARTLRWRFRCRAKDVGFSVRYARAGAAAEEADDGARVVVANARRMVHRGSFAVPASGAEGTGGATVRFVFDNTFSWLANKRVELRWRVEEET